MSWDQINHIEKSNSNKKKEKASKKRKRKPPLKYLELTLVLYKITIRENKNLSKDNNLWTVMQLDHFEQVPSLSTKDTRTRKWISFLCQIDSKSQSKEDNFTEALYWQKWDPSMSQKTDTTEGQMPRWKGKDGGEAEKR